MKIITLIIYQIKCLENKDHKHLFVEVFKDYLYSK
ncbi:MAG: hypothetical protein RL348_566 [Bacteroidota bacterium]|jgi:hypothetical protein